MIAFSTEPLDLTKASEAIKAAYSLVGRQKPVILACSSPYSALNVIVHLQMSNQFGNYLEALRELYFDPYFPEMFTFSEKLVKQRDFFGTWTALSESLWSDFKKQYWRKLVIELAKIRASKIEAYDLRQRFRQQIIPLNYVGNYMSGKWELWSGSTDFCISVLKVHYNPRTWEVIQSLVSECGWIFPFENIALVCTHPIKLMLDTEKRLHAEGEPAVRFADGSSLYFHHGVRLPEQ